MSGDFLDDDRMLVKHFKDNFPTFYPTMPIHEWGGSFDPEVDAKVGSDYVRYVRISNAVLNADVRAVGRDYTNAQGAFSAELFSPQALVGAGYIKEVVRDIAIVMKPQRLGNLILLTPFPEGTPFDEGIWWRQLVTCPYDSDHIP